MRKNLVGLMAVVMLLMCIQNAFALVFRQELTPEIQGQLGLQLTLTATPDPATPQHEDAVLIRIEIPQKGELEALSGVQMELRDGTNTLLTSRMITTTQDGSVVASFYIARSLVGKCCINLLLEKKDDPLYFKYYAVNLKSYLDVIPN